MVDYLLVKRNNHISVVVYQGTVLAATAIGVRNTSFPVHAHPKSKQYVLHLCSGQGSDPYCFFPVNLFVDETDLSFEKNKILMPIKHHFGKSEWLKIN